MSTIYCGDNCNHTGPHNYPPSQIAMLEALQHRHSWVYDGQTNDGSYLYHCDFEDPPLVRVVPPATQFTESVR